MNTGEIMFEQMKLEQIVDEVLAGLTERERYVLEQRYGYNGKPRTQKDIAIEFGVNHSHISKIEQKALIQLRYQPTIKELYSFLYEALSRGKDDFYYRFFAKLFIMNRTMILKTLQAGPPTVEEPSQTP